MEREISVDDPADFREVISEVEHGTTVVLTRDGKPLARVVPTLRTHDVSRAAAAAKRIRDRSKNLSLDGLKITDLVREGRKY